MAGHFRAACAVVVVSPDCASTETADTRSAVPRADWVRTLLFRRGAGDHHSAALRQFRRAAAHAQPAAGLHPALRFRGRSARPICAQGPGLEMAAVVFAAWPQHVVGSTGTVSRDPAP